MAVPNGIRTECPIVDYEADGQTKEIRYANGVVIRFTYSPERRWLTRIETLAPRRHAGADGL